jgi:hypothetical protein
MVRVAGQSGVATTSLLPPDRQPEISPAEAQDSLAKSTTFGPL